MTHAHYPTPSPRKSTRALCLWVVFVLTAAAPCTGYQATIKRDRYGIPHIVADTLVDAGVRRWVRAS